MTAAIDAEVISRLIGSIYDCALDPELWPATLTELRLALTFHNASMSVMAMPSGKMLLNVTSGIEGRWLEIMSDHGPDVVEQWGGAEVFYSHPLEEPAVLSWKRPRAEWENNRYVVEWVKPQGIFDVLGWTLARDAETFGSIGLGRHISAGEIGTREVDAARLLIPHFQRAVAISRVLDLKAITSSSFSATLDTLAAAVMLVDADLRIVHTNEAAERLLSQGDPILSDRGTLALRSRAMNAALGVAVRQASKTEAAIGRRGFGMPVPRINGKPSVLHVLPLRHGKLRPGLMPSAVAAVFVAPAAAPAPPPTEAVSVLFDLTPAEARIFELVCAGKTQTDIAAELRISKSTVKTHLLHVFDKTGCRRQVDLVKLAADLSLPA
jgi:DNA-binding CsgD family transcriptional regulator